MIFLVMPSMEYRLIDRVFNTVIFILLLHPTYVNVITLLQTTTIKVQKVFPIIPIKKQDDDYSYKVSIEYVDWELLSEEEIEKILIRGTVI